MRGKCALIEDPAVAESTWERKSGSSPTVSTGLWQTLEVGCQRRGSSGSSFTRNVQGRANLTESRCRNAHRLISGNVGQYCSLFSLSLFSFPVCECSPVPASSFLEETCDGREHSGRELEERQGLRACPTQQVASGASSLAWGLQPGTGPAVVPNWIVLSLPSNSHRPSGADSFVAVSGSPKCGLLSSPWTSAQKPVGSPDSQSKRTELIGHVPR